MIKFFRQIRQSLLSAKPPGQDSRAGRIRNYFLYAIGEIALVMIGILLALQVNNWNDDKKDAKMEQVVLRSLRENIANNLDQLQESHISVEETYLASLKLLDYIQPQDPVYTFDEVDSLISTMFTFSSFEPASGAIQEVINSGQLSILNNQDLRIEISKWSQIIEDTQEDIKITNDYLFHEVIVYLSENALISNEVMGPGIMANTNLLPLPETRFDQNYTAIMSSVKFENMVRWNAINLAFMLNEFVDFRKYLENLLTLIDSEIKP